VTTALSLTQADLVRALAALRDRPAVDRAVAERAEALARAVADAVGDEGVSVEVVRRGAAEYAVVLSGPEVVARAFGSSDGGGAPTIGTAIARITEQVR